MKYTRLVKSQITGKPNDRVAEASAKFKVFEMGDRVRHTVTGDEGVVTNPNGYIGGTVSVLWQKSGGCHPASVDILERIAD